MVSVRRRKKTVVHGGTALTVPMAGRPSMAGGATALQPDPQMSREAANHCDLDHIGVRCAVKSLGRSGCNATHGENLDPG